MYSWKPDHDQVLPGELQLTSSSVILILKDPKPLFSQSSSPFYLQVQAGSQEISLHENHRNMLACLILFYRRQHWGILDGWTSLTLLGPRPFGDYCSRLVHLPGLTPMLVPKPHGHMVSASTAPQLLSTASQKPNYEKKIVTRLKTPRFCRGETSWLRGDIWSWQMCHCSQLTKQIPVKAHKAQAPGLRRACDHFEQGPTKVWGLILFSHLWWSW